MESELLRLGKDVIPPFSGEGDVVGWIKKVKLVTKLQKVQDLASFIPLFLHGDALALYFDVTLHPLAPTHVNFLLTMSLLTPASDQLVVRGGNAHFFTYTRIRSRERRK